MSFQQQGFLNQPPGILRAAVQGLRTRYERKGSQLEKAVTAILNDHPRMKQKYKRPDTSTDCLYRAEFTHPPGSESSCTNVCGDSPDRIISRPERTVEDDTPTIHYGLIASGNQLMKDASIRDKLAADKDILCFEMEAAGLMNHFACLVIRGICDYSDSHKNDEWQGYAAMIAAAYAMDILYHIPVTRVETEKRITGILSSGQFTRGPMNGI